MNPMDAFAQEFEHESAATRTLIEAVPEDKYGWRAHEKAMTLGELVGHLAGICEGMPQVMDGDSFDIAQRPGPDAGPTNRADALARFDAATKGALAWMTGLGDRALDTWKLYSGEQELMAMPRMAAIRGFLMNHSYHHRGQLSGYLRAAGAAVPSVYGPTADVDPFA